MSMSGYLCIRVWRVWDSQSGR